MKETFSGSIELNPSTKDKTIKGEKPTESQKPETRKDLLENIIDKINLMFQGQFTEADRVIVETIYDKLKEQSKQLKKQAKNNDEQMFENNIFPQIFDKVAQSCYMEQMDAFAKLFENDQFYKHVMSEIGKAMYFNMRNEGKKVNSYKIEPKELLSASEPEN